MERSKVAQIISLFFVLAVASGCAPLLNGFYGIKKPQPIDDEQIREYAEKLKLPVKDIYQIDTSYLTFILSLDTTKFKSEQKNHFQPLQVLYYNLSGDLISFHINCYAGGFPNLKWNREGYFDTFPPKTQAPLDNILPYGKLSDYLITLSSSAKPIPTDYDYTVVVFWNRFMKRQSKRLIQTVRNNCRLAKDKKVKIVYVNDDNLFAGR